MNGNWGKPLTAIAFNTATYSTLPVHKLYNAVSYNMCTCTLYNMVTCLLRSLDQSTTDNYQLLTLTHCIISPVNTYKYVHTQGGSATVTCSRGQSLSPSAWSSGRGLVSLMDSFLS